LPSQLGWPTWFAPKDPQKRMIYECGETPVGSPWAKFNIRFYVVALIFLIFDVEVVLLFPWAINYREYGVYGFFVGFIFLSILFLGMLYEWRKGDLEWARPKPNIPTLDTIHNVYKVEKETEEKI